MDPEGNTLVLFAGQFDWDLIHNHLYYQGFVDSTYRDVEIWKHPDQDVVFGLMPDRNQVVASTSGSVAVRDTIRALERGSGFLFEDVNPDVELALARAKKGIHLVWEEGCDRFDQRGCELTAYGVEWGEDEFTLGLVWLFGFQDVSSARTAAKKLESFFEESMPREVQVSQINHDGEFVIVEASIDKDRFSFLTSATKMVIRPEPEVLPRPEPTPTLAIPVIYDEIDEPNPAQMADMLSEVGGESGENTLRQGGISVTAGPEDLDGRLISARTRSFTGFAWLLLALTVGYCLGVAGRFPVLTAREVRPEQLPLHPLLLVDRSRGFPKRREFGNGLGETADRLEAARQFCG